MAIYNSVPNLNGVRARSPENLQQLFEQTQLYRPSPMAMAGTNVGTDATLANAMFANEYAKMHPFKTGFSKITGKSNGYVPLGTVTNNNGNVLKKVGKATSNATDVATDVAGEGLSAVLQNKGLKGLFDKSNYGWSAKSGVKAFGKNVGKWGNVAGGVMQGIQGINNLSQLSNANSDTQELASQILNSYNSNPMAGLNLTAGQKNLIREIQNGGVDSSIELADIMPNDLGDILSPAIQAGLGLATGGVPGAIIGGVGGLVNGGLENATEASQLRNSELEALLNSLEMAEMEYQQMLRAGAQRRFEQFYA